MTSPKYSVNVEGQTYSFDSLTSFIKNQSDNPNLAVAVASSLASSGKGSAITSESLELLVEKAQYLNVSSSSIQWLISRASKSDRNESLLLKLQTALQTRTQVISMLTSSAHSIHEAAMSVIRNWRMG